MSFAARQIFAPIDFKTRFRALDGVRALAVTMVFLAHYGGGAHGGRVLQLLNSIRQQGTAGVDVFFVLSGFLITGILFDTRHDSRFFLRFFGRRTVRIFPIVYLLFAVLALLTPILHYAWTWKHLTFLVYVGNMFGNADFGVYELLGRNPNAAAALGHLWSLCVEEQFYLIWPVVVWLVRDRVKLVWTTVVVSVGTLMLRMVMLQIWSPEMAERWIVRTLPFRLDDLMFGAMLALLLRGPAADRVQRAMKWLFFAGFAGFVLISRYSTPHSFLTLSIGLTVVGLGSMGLIGWTLDSRTIASRIFDLSPLRLLGRYSYGFYVWSLIWLKAWIVVLGIVATKTHSLAIGGLVELPLAFLTSFLVAKLSYDLFEVKFLKLKRRFEYDSELAAHRTAFAADGN